MPGAWPRWWSRVSGWLLALVAARSLHCAMPAVIHGLQGTGSLLLQGLHSIARVMPLHSTALQADGHI